LTRKNTFLLPLWSFQGARELQPSPREDTPQPNDSADGLSKLNSVDAELDVLPGESQLRTAPRLPKAIGYQKV